MGVAAEDENSEAESNIEDELLRKEIAEVKWKRHTEQQNQALLEIISPRHILTLASNAL